MKAIRLTAETRLKRQMQEAAEKAYDAECKKVANREARSVVADMNDKFMMDYTATILWILHIHFGFGKDRLRKFLRLFYQEKQAMLDYYRLIGDIEDEKFIWICTRELQRYGFGIDKEEKNAQDGMY